MGKFNCVRLSRLRVANTAMVLVCVSVLLMISGCSGPSKSDLEIENNQLKAEVNKYKIDKAELEKTLKVLSGNGEIKTAIEYVDSKKGAKTFNRINDKIIFKAPLEYPESTQAPNNSKFNLSSNITLVPTSNWVLVSDGTSLELNHTSDICGIIKVSKINKSVKTEEVHSALDKFCKEIPSESDAVYGNVFLDNFSNGEYFKKNTLVDGKPSVMIAGTMGSGNIALTFLFMYDGDNDKTRDELIANLINSMQINGLKVKFE